MSARVLTLPITGEQINDLLELVQEGQGAVTRDFVYRDSEERERLFRSGSEIRLLLHRLQCSTDPVDVSDTAVAILGRILRKDREHLELRGGEQPRQATFMPGGR